MFKSLRKKFITTAIGSVAVVIAILAVALNFINFNKLEERIDILIDTYYEYIFNCKTGKYTRKEYERYNENAMDMPTLPPLKNSKKNKQRSKNSISISEEESLLVRACSSCLYRPITIIITNEKIIFNLIIQFSSQIV